MQTLAPPSTSWVFSDTEIGRKQFLKFLARCHQQQGRTQNGGCQATAPHKLKFKNTDFVDTIILNVLHD